MDKYNKINLDRWNELALFNFNSKFYDIEGFIAGRNSLGKIDENELGYLKGKRILHLQCHFGLDSISLVRKGASVVGIDFSEEAIKKGNELKKILKYSDNELKFIKCDVLELDSLNETKLMPESFDIVYTSYGVLGWLNDLNPWGKSIYKYLKPGGFFLVIDLHPFAYTYDELSAGELKIKLSYFHTGIPDFSDEESAYSDLDGSASFNNTREYYWAHNIGYIIGSLTEPGLVIEYVHEFPYISWKFLPILEKLKDGYWHFPKSYDGPILPLLFSLKAKKVN